SQHGNSTKHKRVNDGCRVPSKCQQPRQNRADQTDSVRFKNVRRHSCAIAYVVADVVSNDGWITWIIFLEAFFDFADQIGTDVGGFGVNAAAESRKNANETAAQRQTH